MYTNIKLLITFLLSTKLVFAGDVAVVETTFGNKANIESIKLAREAGYEGIQMHSGDFRVEDGDNSQVNLDIAIKPELLASWKKEADAQGIKIVSLNAGGLNSCEVYGKDKELALRIAKQTIDGCAYLGCKQMLFPFFGKSKIVGQNDDALKGTIAFFNELLPYAKEKGVVICIEAPFSTERIMEIIKGCNSHEHVKIYYNTGNLYKIENIYDTIRKYGKNHIIQIHCKPSNSDVVGDGNISLLELADAMVDSGYEGDLVYEAASAKLPKPNAVAIQKLNELKEQIKTNQWISLSPSNLANEWTLYEKLNNSLQEDTKSPWSLEGEQISITQPKGKKKTNKDYLNISTKARLDNFEFKCDWKIGDMGNSGVFFRTAIGKKHWHSALEIQVLGLKRNNDPLLSTGSIFAVYPAPEKTKQSTVEEWNSVHVIFKDNQFTYSLNGVLLHDIQVDSEEAKKIISETKFARFPQFLQSQTGFIVLQDHGDDVAYRNVKVKIIN